MRVKVTYILYAVWVDQGEKMAWLGSDIQGDYVLDTLTLVCAFALSSQHKNTIKKRNKMKLATAAFLVLCTLVAIGIVSSASK